MAVSSISETYGSDPAGTGDINSNFVERNFLVVTDSKSTTNVDIILSYEWAASDVPVYGDAHPKDSALTCKGVRLDRKNASPRHWVATARYDTAPVSIEERQRIANPNPINRDARVSVRTLFREESRIVDADSDVIANSAGELYEPEVFEIASDVWVVRQNVATISSDWKARQNTRNDAMVTITDGATEFVIIEGTGLLRRLDIGELANESGIAYYPVEAEIEIRETADDWRIDKIDAGFHYLSGSTLKKIMVEDSSGNSVPAAVEVPLNGSGGLLGTPEDSTSFSHNYFTRYKTASWSILPFVEA